MSLPTKQSMKLLAGSMTTLLVMSCASGGTGLKIVAPKAKPVPPEILQKGGRVDDTPTGGLEFDKEATIYLRRKLLWLENDAQTHTQKQLDGLAVSAERMAQTREKGAAMRAKRGTVPLWGAGLLMTGAAIVAAGLTALGVKVAE